MQKELHIVIFSLAIALSSGVSHAASLFDGVNQVIEPVGAGEINWSLGLIRAGGRGVPKTDAPMTAAQKIMAARAAKVDALRNLLETVGGVRIDSQTTVADSAVQNDVIMTRVKGVIKGARVIETRYLPDGSAEVFVEAPIAGILAETIYSAIPDLGSVPLPKIGPPVNTGLIVDAKGIGAKPAMAPKILDEDGREVYSSKFVSREAAVRQGMAAYANDVNEARQNERVTANPIVVKGLKTIGKRGSEIVIRNIDARSLKDTSKNLSFLEQTRVIIVTD